MKSTFGIRLKQFIDHLNLNSIRQFEIECGIGTGAIGKAINHGTDLSKETLNKIIAKYPIINLNWLLTGEGEMLPYTNLYPPDLKTETPEEIDSAKEEALLLRIRQLEEQNYKLVEKLLGRGDL